MKLNYKKIFKEWIMSKVIDINKSVYELCKEFPEIAPILSEMGFTDITKPGMLNTAGRFMTLSKGAMMKKIDLDSVKQKLQENGFEILEQAK
jgi:N-dimethylarginine dimethylaminohydrolase